MKGFKNTLKFALMFAFAFLLLPGVCAKADNVASIGTTEYATIQAAFAAVPEDGTIKLLDNVTVANYSMQKDFAIDLNGKTMAVTGRLNGKKTAAQDTERYVMEFVNTASSRGTITVNSSGNLDSNNILSGSIDMVIDGGTIYHMQTFSGAAKVTMTSGSITYITQDAGTIDIGGGRVESVEFMPEAETTVLNISGKAMIGKLIYEPATDLEDPIGSGNIVKGDVTISGFPTIEDSDFISDGLKIGGMDEDSVLPDYGKCMEITITGGQFGKQPSAEAYIQQAVNNSGLSASLMRRAFAAYITMNVTPAAQQSGNYWVVGSYVDVSGITLNKSTLSLAKGASETLTATVLPANASDKDVTWSSSNTAVATVSAGKVTAVGTGKATITATAGGKRATCEVTVTATGDTGTGEKVTVTVSKAKYEVPADASAAKTVVYKGSTATSAKSITVPSTVKINGKVYKVTAIAKNAFKGNKKATKITVGANVTTIGEGAFSNCKKLKTLNIKSKNLTDKNLNKKAFKGITKKTTLKVPKSKLKAYKTLFRKKGLAKNVTVKK